MATVARKVTFAIFFLGLTMTTWPVRAETWQAAQRLTPLEHESKEAGLVGAHTGGCHFLYKNVKDGNYYYRRLTRDWNWGPTSTVHGGTFSANGRIAESGAQEVWVTWEDWRTGTPNGWAALTRDGGQFWHKFNVTNLPGEPGIKHPYLVPLGHPEGRQMIFTACDVAARKMYYNVWDGFAWLGLREFASSVHVEYWVTGSAWSPANQGVYRQYGRNNDLYINFFDGSNWTGETRLTYDNQFYAWAEVACNRNGDVMVVYERDGRVYAVINRPGLGWASRVDIGGGRLVSITAIGDKPQFYVTWLQLPDQNRIEGRRWNNGSWDPQVTVTQGVPWYFSNQTEVTSDAWGTLYCVFEYWASGGPVFYFTMTRDYESGPTPTPRNTPFPAPTSTITPTFTMTATLSPTPTGTATNTPRNLSPSPTPSPTPVRPEANLIFW